MLILKFTCPVQMSETYFAIYHKRVSPERTVHLAYVPLWCFFFFFSHLTSFILHSIDQMFLCFDLIFLREDLDLCASLLNII